MTLCTQSVKVYYLEWHAIIFHCNIVRTCDQVAYQ